MARHFAYQNSFDEPQRGTPFSREPATFDPAVIGPPVRVVLIAIRHDPLPPVFHGHQLLQRLQALLTTPGDRAELNQQSLRARFAGRTPPRTAAEACEEPPPLPPPRVLPPLSLPPAPDEQTALQPRLVRGDILSDSAGQLYERFGPRVRPLQRVVSGPRGEILELVSAHRADQAAGRRGAAANTRPANSQAGVESDSHAGPKTDARASSPKQTGQPPPRFANVEGQTTAASQAGSDQSAAPKRGLCTDPRRMRMVRPGQSVRQPIQSPIHSPARPPVPPEACPEQVSIQPTRQPVRRPVRRPSQQPSQPPPLQHGAEQRTQPSPQAAVTPPAEVQTDLPKTAIPEEWVKPWELRLSRDEALYDMRIETSAGNTIIGSVRNLGRRLGNRQAFQKWQSLLCGKDLDEQLWGVRPPANQFSHPQVRDWAQRVLAQAGYDPGVMLPEWEIFWRRKGL